MESSLRTSIRPSSYAEILEARDLLAEYAQECSILEIGEFNPQAEMYRAMQDAGLAHMFGAFHVEQLVGFASLLLSILPHYGKKSATVESLFVGKCHRADGYGIEIMDAMEEFAKDAGCLVIFYIAPVGSQLEKLLSLKKGYRKTNSVFCRVL
ncbi:MAG TPA: GNAT family N-acetyltransferase [Candidatus Angelobacter sp.]|jgi:GNAT superfamily N-acetyltransferase|nr:GNAT family N-acetyltransferase [Candidatus Angelobacter sp.]